MNTLERLSRIESTLERILQLLEVSNDDVLDVVAFQAMTGLSRSAIYEKTANRNGLPPEIPHYRQGKRLYFKLSEVRDWLTANRVASRADIEEDVVNRSFQRMKRRSLRNGMAARTR